MALECLLLVRNPHVLCQLSGLLAHFGIDARVAATPEDALATLHNSRFDAVMVDCVEFDEGPEVLRRVHKMPANLRAIAFAIVSAETPLQERAAISASFVLERSLSAEGVNRTLRAARALMIAERRRYFRFKVDMTVSLVQGVNGKKGGIRFSYVSVRSRQALSEWLDQRAEEDGLTPKPQQRGGRG